MKYDKTTKTLDVTRCEFEDLEHMERVIKSARTPQGVENIVMTEDQISWYDTQQNNVEKSRDIPVEEVKQFKGKNIIKKNV